MSEWNTLADFIFYVCPMTLFTIWILEKTGANIFWIMAGAIFAILFCTGLITWMSPGPNIDDTIEEWNNIMHQTTLDDFR